MPRNLSTSCDRCIDHAAIGFTSFSSIFVETPTKMRTRLPILWDGLPFHRSRAMQAFIKKQRKWLVVERLPAYAPDLNPVEQVWGNLKGGELANLCLDTLGEAEMIVDQGLCRIGNETRLAFAYDDAAAGASYREIAVALSGAGVTTRTGGFWNPNQVRRIALRVP